jgi:AI-2E family transporter
VVQPLVYGRAVKVNPLVTIISLLVGAELLGILGVLLAIPTAAAIQIISVHGGPQDAAKLRALAPMKARRAHAHAGPRDQSSGAARPAKTIHRLTTRPTAPATIRITPTAEMLMPAPWAVTQT